MNPNDDIGKLLKQVRGIGRREGPNKDQALLLGKVLNRGDAEAIALQISIMDGTCDTQTVPDVTLP